jgi:hypothetical protein
MFSGFNMFPVQRMSAFKFLQVFHLFFFIKYSRRVIAPLAFVVFMEIFFLRFLQLLSIVSFFWWTIAFYLSVSLGTCYPPVNSSLSSCFDYSLSFSMICFTLLFVFLRALRLFCFYSSLICFLIFLIKLVCFGSSKNFFEILCFFFFLTIFFFDEGMNFFCLSLRTFFSYFFILDSGWQSSSQP